MPGISCGSNGLRPHRQTHKPALVICGSSDSPANLAPSGAANLSHWSQSLRAEPGQEGDFQATLHAVVLENKSNDLRIGIRLSKVEEPSDTITTGSLSDRAIEARFTFNASMIGGMAWKRVLAKLSAIRFSLHTRSALTHGRGRQMCSPLSRPCSRRSFSWVWRRRESCMA